MTAEERHQLAAMLRAEAQRIRDLPVGTLGKPNLGAEANALLIVRGVEHAADLVETSGTG